ncbi:MAG: Gfo/Idh/MocA family oxidoreductase [Ruminococcaceae bacterium]|nr:Gfo/Idh/MocA family oxidoreductase [Oscillospiraceae bacterium]
MLKAVIIGLGGVARTCHFPAYKYLEDKGKVKLVAGYDPYVKSLSGDVKFNLTIDTSNTITDLKLYDSVEEMLETEKPDIVDICVPTPFHSDMACEMLEKGYHVFCEKPMARTYEQAERMVNAANKAGKKLMIGQCVRFFPAYAYIKQAYEKGELGKPVTAMFRRISFPPAWGAGSWFMNYEKSGGCLLDMSLHDIDFAQYLYGAPEKVSCFKKDVRCACDSVLSTLVYPDFNIHILGDWAMEGVPFLADFQLGFEKATCVMQNDVLTVYNADGTSFVPELDTVGGHTVELENFADWINGTRENKEIPPESTALSIKLAETLAKSAFDGGKLISFEGR